MNEHEFIPFSYYLTLRKDLTSEEIKDITRRCFTNKMQSATVKSIFSYEPKKFKVLLKYFDDDIDFVFNFFEPYNMKYSKTKDKKVQKEVSNSNIDIEV